MRGRVLATVVACSLSVAGTAWADDPAARHRWVQASSLMLRASAAPDGRILDRLLQGQRVALIGTPASGDEWCQVWGPSYRGVQGYVACRYLSAAPVEPARAGEAGVPPDRRWVTGSRLQLRAEPRPDARALASLALNTPVRLTGPQTPDGYCAVELLDGPTLAGYTACRYLDLAPLVVANLLTPQRDDGSENPDFDPARAFWISPSWDLLAVHARRVAQQREALGAQAPKGADEQLERMKARLSGQVQPSGDVAPRAWRDWTEQLGGAGGIPPSTLRFYGRAARDQADAFLRALPALPAVRPSWWRSETELASPDESLDALTRRFGGQVRWWHESLQPGSPNRGSIEPGIRIERMTQALHRLSLMSNHKVRDEALAPERQSSDWDPTVDVNCDGWQGGFFYGQADRATLQRNGLGHQAVAGPLVLFQLWSSRPLPPGPAHWTRQPFPLDRDATGFVSGEWRIVDLDRDGVPDLAWLQATGQGPGHLGEAPAHDDPWFRMLLANVAGRWRLLAVDTFSYGCGC